jgi:hypothetical protein
LSSASLPKAKSFTGSLYENEALSFHSLISIFDATYIRGFNSKCNLKKL